MKRDPTKFACVVLALVLSPGLATGQAATVQTGTFVPAGKDRKDILETARASVKCQIGRTVRFVVKDLHQDSGWTFLSARMQESDGRPLSYAGTKYEDAAKHGFKSNMYAALLQRDGGQWIVKVDSVGPTDVPWIGWSTAYGAPKVIFPNLGMLPQSAGACITATIALVGPRLEGVPDSGSTVVYVGGGRQVSYERVAGIQASKAGDAVKLCLVSVPKNCPKGDDRGKVYHAVNLRTNAAWQLPDS